MSCCLGRASFLGVVMFALAACHIGNDLGGQCARGDTCTCDIIGNCTRDCPGGGCNFECRGTSNCVFSCAGGGCMALCENTGNCILECDGGGCDVSCHNTGTCIVNNPHDMSVRDQSVPRDYSTAD